MKGRTGPKGTAGSKARGSMIRTDDPTQLKVHSPHSHMNLACCHDVTTPIGGGMLLGEHSHL